MGTLLFHVVCLSSKNPQKTVYFFSATIDTMSETTSITTECHETVQRWKYSNSFAVDKNL